MRDRIGRTTPVLAAAGIGLVVVLAVLVVTGASAAADAAIIAAVRDPSIAEPMSPLRAITELGSTWAIVVVALVTAGVAALVGPWRHGVAGAATTLLASLLNSTIKIVIARERPDLLEPIVAERGFSFPSGHAAMSMVAYGILAVVIGRSRLPRALRGALIGGLVVLVFLVGISRVWLGVHYPTDVLAGWIAGAVIVAIYRVATRDVPREPSDVAVDQPA